MKISKLILVLFLGLMALTSCDKELIKNEPDLPPMTEAEYDLVEADLTTEVEGELRLHQVIEDEGTGRISEPFMAEKDLYIYVVIRGGESSNRKYAFQTLKFTKVRGQNKVTYKGQIKVPKNITTGLEIAAIVLNEEGGETYTYVVDANHALAAGYKNMVFVNQDNVSLSKIENVPNSSGKKKVRTLIPYLANWTKIEIVNKRLVIKGGVSGQPQCLHFHPSGVLLRFKIQNMKSTPVTVSKIKVESNMLRACWGYDFTKNTFTEQELLEGFVNSEGPQSLSVIYTIPGGPITLQKADPRKDDDESEWYYIWLMPIKEKTGLTGDTKIYLLHDGMPERLAFKSTRTNFNLKAMGLTLQYKDGATPPTPTCEGYPDGLLPLDYVASHNLKRVGSGAWAIEGNNQAPANEVNQIYELSEVAAFLRTAPEAGRTIAGQKYYIPDAKDWNAILPDFFVPDGGAPNPAQTYQYLLKWPTAPSFAPQFRRVRRDEIRVQKAPAGVVYKGSSYFMAKHEGGSKGVVYALRLVDTPNAPQGKRNCKALAYRYEFSGYRPQSGNQPHPYDSYVKVWSRYVGGIYENVNITEEKAKELLQVEVSTTQFWTPGAEPDNRNPASVYSNNGAPVQLPAKGAQGWHPTRGWETYSTFGIGFTKFIARDGQSGFYGTCPPDATSNNHFVGHLWVYDFSGDQISLRARQAPFRYAPDASGRTMGLKTSVRLFKQDPPARTAP